MENKIKFLAEDFFQNFGIKFSSLEVEKNDENNSFLIKIKTDFSGKLIWPHWKNLDAINQILKLIILKNTDLESKTKIFLEVNDYLKSKDDKLKDFVLSKIKFVERTGKDFQMPFFSAYERKKIHAIVADSAPSNIFTKSIWEWNARRLYICKAEKKLTIDIDSMDI